MHNLDEIVKIYFNYVSIADIFSERVKANCFDEKTYKPLAAAYLNCYSDTEQSNLYEYIQSSLDIDGHSYARKKGRTGLNVFAALEELAANLFVLEDNEAKCRYENLLRFRNVEEYVDQDLLIAAFLIQQDGDRRLLRQKFMTSSVNVSHSNLQLHRIMEEGIAENHFHLYGSAPIFHLIWIQMMNDIDNEDYEKLFEEVDNTPRTVRIHYKNDYSENKCREKVLLAALIRLYLIKLLNEEKQIKENDSSHENRDREEVSLDLVRKILSGERSVKDYCATIQREIRVFRALRQMQYGTKVADYALAVADASLKINSRFEIFAGERYMIYQLLKKEYMENPRGKGDILSREYEWVQWFYAYLVIKNQVRNELLQTNRKVGFENFSIISHRKNVYADYQTMAKLAICGSMENENIKKFEVRFSPAESVEKLVANMMKLEDFELADKKKKKAVYYVLHFAKSADENPSENYLWGRRKVYRHKRLRDKLERQAGAVERLRDEYPEYAARVLGIDACAQEIGCRPEVFAPVFRRMVSHTSRAKGNKEIPQLRVTYHVGEEFLDVVDGLRAVDEAVRFLNLKCGSRIGHGTVLGISVENWYQKKRNTIVLSRQDYLDNIVWMYHKINEFHIEGCAELLEFLQQEFDEIFYLVYRRNIDMEEIGEIWRKREMTYRQYKYGMQEYQPAFDIFSYYAAWKLRGDEPSLYERGYYQESVFQLEKTGKKVNMEYPKPFELRKQCDVSILYYYYHFNWLVYKDGKQKIEKYMPDCYVDGAVKLQKAMQSFIGRNGIGIECNPSSNLKISTMDNYAEHPIVQLYNKDLEKDPQKLQECLQLFVSINTDDKGVFYTSLENEYALMACALEKVKDKQGSYIYNRQMIYQWLDNIRKMGLQQSFLGGSKRDDR